MKKGILVVSFGTSFEEVRKRCIDSVEVAIAQAFPTYEIRRAFTSNMIIKKLKERDQLHINTPLEALKKMVEEGITEIHVQPLHIIPGFEYEKVYKAVKTINHKRNITVTIGQPLLSQEHHYDEVIDALESEISSIDSHGYVLMGHGTEHHANACYSMLQAKLNDRRSDVFVSNVEGYPELEHIKGNLSDYQSVTLMPLMLVAGDHAMNDMAGEEDDSYKSVLLKEDIQVLCRLIGLGELAGIQELFIKRIKDIVD